MEVRKREDRGMALFALRSPEVRSDLGARLRQIRASRTQQEMADLLGVAKRTYASYERNERVPEALALLPLIEDGWNANWVLAGRGDERLKPLQDKGPAAAASAMHPVSQPARPEEITMAVQLAEEALAGARLEPADYGKLVSLIYSALVSGLPGAQVLEFAKPAARGLQGASTSGKDVGGAGKAAAG